MKTFVWLLQKEDIMIRHLVPCGKPPKKEKSAMAFPNTRGAVREKNRRLGRDPTVLLTVVGDSAPEQSEMLNPDLILDADESMEEFVKRAQEVEMTTVIDSETMMDDGTPITINRISYLSRPLQRNIASSKEYWHKFIIYRGAGYSKMEIMKTILEAVQPHLITPVLYRREGNSVVFLDRNCPHALEKLQDSSTPMQIQVVDSSGPFGPVQQLLDVAVILRHARVQDVPVHVQDTLINCLLKRYDKFSRTLDLSGFHLDPELSEVVLWPLWMPGAFLHVTFLLKPRISMIRHLCLADNELTQLPKLHSFMLSHLEILDLSSNKIPNLSSLKSLQGSNLVEISLDNNPLCSAFNDEQSYIQAIKDILPFVKRIDGVSLTRADLPVVRRNYVPNSECIPLVDQFLQHYFMLLDGDDRQKLRGIYHPDALFSLTCNYVPGQSTSSTARLTRYTLESRNLLRMSDYSKSQQLLNQGADNVLEALHRLPRSEHDPYSFSVDMPYYSQDLAVIIVNGVFREPSMMKEKLVRSFSRTFILRKVASKEYLITNEMLTISNASTKQAEESFQYPKPKISMAKLSFNPAQDLTDSDRKQMAKILSRLTEMNQQWSQKCLEQTKWDITRALSLFTEFLQVNKLPAEAFEHTEDRK